MVEVKVLTDIGGREENQDRAAYFKDEEHNETLIIIADGMGGHSGGSLAAETIIQTAETAWANRKSASDIENFLNTMVMDAHKAINKIGKEKGMDPHSTLVALYLSADQAISVHVGDSRIIQFNDNGYVKRSMDHSIAQLFVLQGKITEEEMASHPDQNKLTTSMGGEDEPDLEITHWALEEGLKFILCSDGFWEIVNVDTMSSILNSENLIESLQNRTRDALRLASDDQDNTTAVVVKIANENKKKSLTSNYILITAFAIIILSSFMFFSENKSEDITTQHGVEDKKAQTDTTPVNPETIPTKEELDELAKILKLQKIILPYANKFNEDKVKSDNEENNKETNNKGSSSKLGKQSTVEEEVEIIITNSSQTSAKVTEHLRKNGVIGKDDKLIASRKGKLIKETNSRITQHQQMHKGIFILGAVITTVEQNGKITVLQGKTSPNITISIIPTLNYMQALKKSRKHTNTIFESKETGSLIIIKQPNEYVLAWIGRVSSNIEEVIVMNAHTAEIILRRPIIISGK
ncbi:MAG: serine/threonine-protein phosphatase [Gammaproteobacteria bacterium]|nr:serine/threonine-protein phosphatase [Gammaproteobacteria bacterium]